MACQGGSGGYSCAMQVAILTFDGFNEIDSFVALNILNRVALRAHIAAPSNSIQSMNGVRIDAAHPLAFAREADAVIVGSGTRSLAVSEDTALMSQLVLDPQRQLIGSQCSGALILDKLGLTRHQPICTDGSTRRVLESRGSIVLDQPFICHGNVATAGGCLSAPYLAAWIITRLLSSDAARTALRYVAPVGEADAYIDRAMSVVEPPT